MSYGIEYVTFLKSEFEITSGSVLDKALLTFTTITSAKLHLNLITCVSLQVSGCKLKYSFIHPFIHSTAIFEVLACASHHMRY